MAITLDISSDYELFDNSEAIKIQNPSAQEIVANNVIKRPSMIGMDSGGDATVFGASTEFLVWKNELPVGFVPKINAKITDQFNKKYRIDSVTEESWRTKWNIRATSEASEGID